MKSLALGSFPLLALLLLSAACSSRAVTAPAPTVMSRSAPVPPSDLGRAPGVTTQIARAGRHACRIDGERKLWCWGANDWGQVRPDARTVVEPVPRVYPGLRNVTHVALARDHACVIHEQGELACWGHNERGQLGDGTTMAHHAPAPVRAPGAVDRVVVDLGLTCAHVRDGTWHCWGGEGPGLANLHLGRLLTSKDPRSTSEIPRLASIAELSLGYWAGAALSNEGTVLTWGRDQPEEAPSWVPGLRDATDVAAGMVTACAIHEHGKVSCWSPQRGGADLTVVPNLEGARSLMGEDESYCALLHDDSAWCWRAWRTGEDFEFVGPERVQASGPVLAMAPGCVLTRDQRVQCRGDNLWGDLGNGYAVITPLPSEVRGLGDVTAIDTAGSTTCALRAEGDVWCWGGLETTGFTDVHVDRSLATQVEGVSEAVELHTPCARRRDGSIVCWDDTRWGRVMRGNRERRPLQSPPLSQSVKGAVVQFVANDLGLCVLTDRGEVSCWGRDYVGEDAKNCCDMNRLESVREAVELAAGREHACARLRTGRVRCWGYGPYGQFGTGTRFSGSPTYEKTTRREPLLEPVQVHDIGDARALWAGHTQTCLLRRDDDAPWCFGNMGYEHAEGPHASLLPARVPSLKDLTALSPGQKHLCGLTARGGVRCEGLNERGALGTNDAQATEHEPFADGVTGLSAGPLHTCALREGHVWCWGNNEAGELGIGTWLRLDHPTESRF